MVSASRLAPRVLHVTDHLQPGGAERMFAGLVVELDRAGRARSVVCTATSARADRALVASIVAHTERAVALERRKLYDPRLTVGLARVARRHGVQLIHSHPGTAHGHARLAARTLGLPHVTTLHTIPGPEIEDSAPRMLVDRWTVGWSDAIVAPSPRVARAYAEAHGLPVDRLHVVPNVPMAQRAAPGFDRTAVRAGLGVTGDAARLVVCLARLAEAKAVDDLARATAHLRDRVPGVRVLVAGAGPREDAIRALADDLGLGDAFALLGHRDDVGELLAAADAFCLPSRHEGLPVSLVEAMEAGLPCVATATGGVPDLVADHETGLLVAPGAPADLAQALTSVLTDAPLARRLGEAARAHVAREHSPAVAAGRYGDLYEELLDGARHP
jgi:glycosyltransferase involved in cell wall biosynthesis